MIDLDLLFVLLFYTYILLIYISRIPLVSYNQELYKIQGKLILFIILLVLVPVLSLLGYRPEWLILVAGLIKGILLWKILCNLTTIAKKHN